MPLQDIGEDAKSISVPLLELGEDASGIVIIYLFSAPPGAGRRCRWHKFYMLVPLLELGEDAPGMFSSTNPL